MDPDRLDPDEGLNQERNETLNQYEELVEVPMLVLSLAWLVLIVVDLVRGLSPTLNRVVTFLWALFVIDFAIRFFLTPHKLRYVRTQWLTVISLALPALRVVRFVRLARVARLARVGRGANLVRVLSSFNRGMRTLRRTFARRGFSYLILLTVLVILVGAGGMFAFEQPQQGSGGLGSYGDALWWTAMILTTLGSEYWPTTLEGRLLAFLISLYALGVFSYLTATIATFFIGQEAQAEESELASAREIRELRAEVRALREELLANRGPAGEE
jgi:voltage-gated potassium channel